MATDSDRLRMMLEDPDADIFDDTDIAEMLAQANNYEPIVGNLDLSQLYWAAYLGWTRKASLVNVIKQKVDTTTIDTTVAYNAALKQAQVYRHLANSEMSVGVQSPTLDIITPSLTRSTDGTSLIVRDSLSEIW